MPSVPGLLPSAPHRTWWLRTPTGRTLATPAGIMGILNVTPDSFSDGGLHRDPLRAVEHGLTLAQEGAAWIDVGGESTRPGAQPVPVDEEMARVLPVVAALRRALPVAVGISIDTRRAAVARAALAAGAEFVNDISAGRDPDMFATVAAAGAALCLMHMQGEPANMQTAPCYDDVVAEVQAFLLDRVQAAIAAGIPRASLLIDPGIGFGKTWEHNLALLKALPHLSQAGLPVLVGLSRKSLIPRLIGRNLPADQRDGVSHVLHALAAPWCALIRVHEVAGARDAVRVAALAMAGEDAAL